MAAEFNVQTYGELGKGRESPNYSQTIVLKGRIKESIDYVVSKNYDIMRQDEIYRAVKIMGKFQHDNIVKFVNWYVTNTKLYLILEYCPGGTLLDLLDRDVCLPESVISIFASDLLSALHYIHKKGYIFHDLSPRNILLDECGVLKLSDFARATEIDDPVDLNLVDLEILEYLPPEVLISDSPSSFASDFYSLGCLMYKMATGATPFLSSTVEELKEKILSTNPQPISECSPEFNELVLSCLNKNPYKRPTWDEIVKHPFWQDTLKHRPDQEFKNFNAKLMPPQPIWESKQNETFDESEIVDLSKSLRSSILPPKKELIPSARAATNSSKKSLSIPKSQSNTQSQKEGDDSIDADIKAEIEDELSINDGNEVEENEKTIESLVIESPLLDPATVVLNPNIETFPLSSTEGITLPVTAQMLKTKPEEAIPKIDNAFNGPDRVKSKAPFLSFLIEQSKSAEVATNLANSSLLSEIGNHAKTTKHPSLSAGFLLLSGTILKFASNISNKYITNEFISNIHTLSSHQQEKVARKGISVLGQLATYIVNGMIKIPMPDFLVPTLVKALNSSDEPIRHYSLRSLANLLYYNYNFDQKTLENIMTQFEFTASMYLTETYSIFVCLAYKKITTPNSTEFVSNLVKNFVSRQSSITQTVAIMIAAKHNLLNSIKDGVISIFNNGNGELRSKSFLAMCLLFNSNASEFVKYSQRFFYLLEKMFNESQDIFECVMMWSISFCEKIVEMVLENNDIDLLNIIYNGMQLKMLSTRLWSPKFEKKISKMIRNNTFNNQKSEVAIQIIQCALCYQLCDASIIAGMCRPLNSQQPRVRFAVVKLVADATMLKPIPTQVLTFVENNILSQLLALLNDEACIIDQTLRILRNSSMDRPEILKQLNKQAIITKIFNSISDNQAALQLALQIIKSNDLSIESLLNTRFVPGIIDAIDKKENSTDAIELLYGALSLIEKKKNRRNSAKSFHNLATIAPKIATLMLEYSKASECLCLMISIFTPLGNSNDVVLESSFNLVASSLSNGYQKTEYVNELSNVVKSLTWAVTNSLATRLKVKGSKQLMSALKKVSENGVEELKQNAVACLKAIK